MTIIIKSITGETVGEYRWDESKNKVVFNPQTEDETFIKVLQDIYQKDYYFDPEKDEISEGDNQDDFNGFVTKAVPELVKAGFRYEIDNY